MKSLLRQVQLHPTTPRGLAGTIATSLRFNSSKTAEKTSNISLTAQVFPLHKENITESDVDEWLNAVKQMRKNGTGGASNELEVFISQLAQPEPFLQEKFEPMIENFTNLIMRHGKKSKAHKILSQALYIVYLKTRRDPMQVLAETLDKLGPLMSTKVEKTGAAKNRTVPYPLNQRQRNRYAITWILEGADKKKSSDYSVRLAEEILSAFEGKSSGYDRKAQMHKSSIAHRAYIRL